MFIALVENQIVVGGRAVMNEIFGMFWDNVSSWDVEGYRVPVYSGFTKEEYDSILEEGVIVDEPDAGFVLYRNKEEIDYQVDETDIVIPLSSVQNIDKNPIKHNFFNEPESDSDSFDDDDDDSDLYDPYDDIFSDISFVAESYNTGW